MTIFEKEKVYLLQTYKRLPIEVREAKGCRIYAADGSVYLDFLGGIAVNSLGHTHPKIADAVCKQAYKFMHVSNYFYQEPQINLAEKLVKMTGFDRVFFSNSGTEAIEGAIKLSRRWGSSRYKNEIIAFQGGFHGRTYGALSIMDKPHYKDNMGPFLPDTKILPYNDIEALRKNINKNTAAVFLEFLQGEGGVSSASKEFVDAIFELKQQFDFLVVADEIQAGVGRTGKFFMFEHYGVEPDVVTLAKGLGGGLPLGAILLREIFANIWQPGMHGTTFGGNALACAAGLVVLDELENGVLDNVNKTGNYLSDNLNKVKADYPDLVKEVRGKGLMQGLLLNFEAAQLVASLLTRKIISNAASGYVLRLVPPLILTNEDVDIFINALRESLEEFSV